MGGAEALRDRMSHLQKRDLVPREDVADDEHLRETFAAEEVAG
jgi:hypothetical protein